MAVGLKASKKKKESWKQYAQRVSRRFGLEREVMDMYENSIAVGNTPDEAAWHALYEWDLLDLAVDEED